MDREKPESEQGNLDTIHPEQSNQPHELSEDSQEDKPRHELELYLTDPHEFLSFCQKDKKIKVMDECNPILNHVYLKDISLHKKGPLEDKIYSKNTKYYCNIRRGNTLCQVYDQNQKEVSLFMCRRGMKKFYDLEPDYLKVNRKLTHQHEKFRHRIFEKLDSYIQGLEGNANASVHLYGIFKENGQHCQISFVKQLGYWLFASKNVAILAKTPDDLKSYQKQRFYWAKLIGDQFFKIIQNFQADKLLEFISQIEGKTLLGEYCGYQEHQHITKYEKIEIIFYGLVETNGIDHCLPVSSCENFLSKYGLKMSRIQRVECLRQKNKIYLTMYKMLKKVAEGSMSQFGEGSVLYIVGDDGMGKQKTIGMCKLKSCEYLIYRKMREMIKIYFAKKGATANNFEKFKFQISSLCQNYFKPPKPLGYYEQVAQRAFYEIKKNHTDFSDNEFRYKFVNFLESIEKKTKERNEEIVEKQSKNLKARRIILICPPLLTYETEIVEIICKKLNIQIEYSYRQLPHKKLQKSILHIVHMVPRLNFEEIQQNVTIIAYDSPQTHSVKLISELETAHDIKKSHLISFIKSEDKRKSIQLLKQKIKSFIEACLEDGKEGERKKIFKFEVAKDIENIKNEIEEKNYEKQCKLEQELSNRQEPIIYVIITLLIPGSGKTCLASTIQKEYSHLNLQVISSDKIRQSVMAKYKGKRKGHEVQIEQSYAATKKKGLEKYREKVAEAIGEKAPSQTKILFIDRVFCPTTVLDNIKEISRQWTKFIIVTQTENPVKLNEHLYPHSLTYLLGCIKRSLERQGHETLSQKPNQIIKVLLKFYQMYRGFGYQKLARQLLSNGIRFQILPLEFVRQINSNENLFLKKKVEECLRAIPPGHEPPESPLYTELIEMIYKYKQHIEGSKESDEEQSKQEILVMNASKLVSKCL